MPSERVRADEVRVGDWLEEHGGEPERAASIRVPYVRVRATPQPEGRIWVPMRPTLWGPITFRLVESEVGSASDWGENAEVEFRHGFVREVRCALADWERYGPGLVARHPIERVEVADGVAVTDNRHVAIVKPWLLSVPSPTLLGGWLAARHGPGDRGEWYVHDTEEEARDAVSHELLAWAAAEAKSRGIYP